MYDDVLKTLVPMVKKYEGLAKLKKDGLVYPYICPAGYPTQGYGLLVKSLKEPPITPLEAEQRLWDSLPYYIEQTLILCPTLGTAPAPVLAAIGDFTFNLGVARLRSS